jgi:hypothetical protein
MVSDTRVIVERELAGRDVVEGPFSPEELDLLLRWRRTAFQPTTQDEHDQFDMLTFRYYTQLGADPANEAWHEAGHAIVGYALGRPIVRLFRRPNGTPAVELAGISQEPPVAFSEADFLAKNRVWALIQVAGYLAELRATGHADPEEASCLVIRVWNHAGYDAARSAAYLSYIEAETSAILDANWGAVGRVATLILGGLPRTGREALAAITGP